MERNIYKIGKELFITSDEEIRRGDYFISLNGDESYLDIILNNEVDDFNEYADVDWIENCKKIILTTDQDLIKDGVQAIDDEFLEWFVNNPSCESVEVQNQYRVKSGTIQEHKDGLAGYEYYEYKIIIPQEEPKQYPIGGYAPGNYTYICVNCKVEFFGDKRVVQCEPCAIQMTKEEPKTNLERLPFPELVKEFAEYYKKVPLVEEAKQETVEEVAEKYVKSDLKKTPLYGMFNDTFIEGAKWMEQRMYSEEEVLETLCKSHNAENTSTVANILKKWFEQHKKK
jgi:DNA-directed RNA polymerase subunit RPC12/RpoP